MVSNRSKPRGTLYIVSAPSGGGKTSLVNALLQSVKNCEVSVSHTTRLKRPGEQHAINYYFIDEIEFKRLIADTAFLEYAQVFGHYYGTSREWVEKKLCEGVDVILEIDWQGAQQVRKMVPEAVGIFILPPSREVLQKRLQERAQDDSQVIARRMAQAKDEIAHYYEYDYVIVNDDFSRALGELKAILQVRRLREEVQKLQLADLIDKLLL